MAPLRTHVGCTWPFGVGAFATAGTRLIHYHCPKVFLLENVPNIVEVDEGRALQLVMQELTAAGSGYQVVHKVVSAYPTVPQKRERLYFVGFRTDTGCAENFVSGCHGCGLRLEFGFTRLRFRMCWNHVQFNMVPTSVLHPNRYPAPSHSRYVPGWMDFGAGLAGH
jgi:site-specific DNA-cytosine methylase